MPDFLIIISLFVSGFLIVQGFVALWQMIYGWISKENLEKRLVKPRLLPAEVGFSLIVPCRHEAGVIGHTLKDLLKIHYPKDKFEILVPLACDDLETIAEVQSVIEETKSPQIRVEIFFDGILGKPHGLNVALAKTKFDYVAVFDAEDVVHRDILNFVNTKIVQEGRKVVQTGVSLLNWWSSWFSIQAVMEYYFWFNSRLFWHADRGIVPLGGVGVFFPKEKLQQIGGWDEKCLTEDAKIGIDLSVVGVEFAVMSQDQFSVKEEVPVDFSGFLKQRTRWIQGFLQILLSGTWRKLSFSKQIIFLNFVLFPFFQFGLALWGMFSVIANHTSQIGLALIAFIPLFLLISQMAVSLAGVVEIMILRKQKLKMPVAIILYILSFVPYQILLTIALIRAVKRQMFGNLGWEKTLHQNFHRKLAVG